MPRPAVQGVPRLSHLYRIRMPPADEIAIRPCNAGDANTLALVGAATFLEAFAGVLEGASIVAHCAKNHDARVYADYLAEPSTRAWIAESAPGGAPVGYLLLTKPDLPLSDLMPEDVELKRIYLFSRFSGSGLGKRLMEQAIVGARELGAGRLLLGVHRENGRALRFYERNGFTPVGVRTFQVGTQIYDDLILARSL